MPPNSGTSPAKRPSSPRRPPSTTPGKKQQGYSALLEEIERTSVPKPGARPPTAIGTTADGLSYLAENAKNEGVVTLPCGIQYKVLKAAKEDAESPKLGTECNCHYRGTLMNGFEFDSSRKRGKVATFAPKNVIRGWTVCMQLMGVGDKWMLYIPSEFGYGDAGRADAKRGQYIPPGAVLIFELEMLKVGAPNKQRPKRPTGMPNAAYLPSDGGDAALPLEESVESSGLRIEAPQLEPLKAQPLVQQPTEVQPPQQASVGLQQAPGAPLQQSSVQSTAPAPKKAALVEAAAFDEGVDTTLEAVAALLNRLEIATLKQALADLGLPTKGEKTQLSERITNALQP